ncbi:MAG: hypothetical protein K0S79_66 [Nitrospira sp.]|jgi:hypothetical protein|nr:hypothetical protein [Nitrospira sp.]
MIYSVEEVDTMTKALRDSHEELRQLATLKEAEAAIAWATKQDFQSKLIEMQTAVIQQQEMIQALLAKLAVQS